MSPHLAQSVLWPQFRIQLGSQISVLFKWSAWKMQISAWPWPMEAKSQWRSTIIIQFAKIYKTIVFDIFWNNSSLTPFFFLFWVHISTSCRLDGELGKGKGTGGERKGDGKAAWPVCCVKVFPNGTKFLIEMPQRRGHTRTHTRSRSRPVLDSELCICIRLKR